MWKHASINRAYRLVWNRVRQAFVPAPETARGHSAGSVVARSSRASACLPPRAHPRWRLLSLALAGAFLAHPALALDAGALPTGGSVAAGTANIAGSGNALTITQDSDRAIVNWQSFDVGANASVRFAQPSTTAATLNRVTGSGASQILGTMTANGQVYLVNPAGVLFGASAQVNVGSLVASTLRIADADFLASRDRFTLDGATGKVRNQGIITAQGGRVALLGARVSNTGTILAPLGDVALAAGRQITLSAGANGHLQIAVDPADVATLASNGGLIQADGGQVVLTAQGADALASAVVSNTGTVQARTVATREGRILLLADQDRGGTTEVAGTLDASAPQGGNGGFIETSAARVKVAAGTTVTTRAWNGKTGTWLIDPNDFTIAAAGGDMTGADVSAALQNTDFEIQSVRGSKSGKGDIFVNDTVNWRANTLTLTAERDIQINAAMNGSEAAGLALRYGQGAPAANNAATYQVRAPVNLASSGRFSTTLGSDGPTLDYTILTGLGDQGSITGTDLQGINGKLSGRYVLGSDIDASATRGWNGGKGFDPLGKNTSYFTGTFDGLGHVISELTINRPDQYYVGLFGIATNATIRHVGLDGISVTGKSGVGGLAGQLAANGSGKARIDNVWVTGNVKGEDSHVGGLVGYNNASDGATISIDNTWTNAAVSGKDGVGGLVGLNAARTGGTANISNAYATGAVTGSAGGGQSKKSIGGLVGYSSADVYNGGGTVSISNAYATGAVTKANPGDYAGGLVGFNKGSVISSYWDRFSTKQDAGIGNDAGTVTNLQEVTSDPTKSDAANYAFKIGAYANLEKVFTSKNASAGWYMIDGQARPFLASEYSTTITNAHQLQLMAMDLGASYTLARDIDARATGLNDGTADSSGGMWTGAGFSPIGRDDKTPFKGTFDGQGHVISGLTINRPGRNYVGLFGWAQDATIRHVGLDNVDVTGQHRVGALVGQLHATNGSTASIDGAWTSGTVKGGLYVGSLVGEVNARSGGTARINNAQTSGKVEGDQYVGGLVGYLTGTIDASWATGDVTGKADIGSLVGWKTEGSINNSGYRLTGDRSISASEGDVNLLGGVVQGDGVAGQTLSVEAGGNASLGTIQLPDNHLSLNVAGDITAPDKVVVGGFTLDRGNWRQVATLTELPTFSASDFRLAGGTFVRATGGDGSAAATPYLLTDVYGLQGMGTLLSGYFTLANDIDAGGTAMWNSGTGFTPVGGNGFYFIGSLDGQDHAISGLVIDRPGVSYIGLFGNANNASISNLSLQGGKITGSDYTGALAGAFSGTLTNVRSGVDVDGGDFTGGLVGRIWYGANNRVSDVWTTGDVAGGDRVGGLAGWNGQGTIRNAGASGKVSGTKDVGGLVGLNDAAASIIGGSASGTVNGVDNVGGLVGWNWGKGTSSNIENSYATGDVTGTGLNTGGLVGYNSGSIWFNADESDSLSVVYASGKVSGVNNVGGLVGLNAGSASLIKNASARGDVVGSGSGAGGLVGRNEGAIDASVAFGINVSGVADVGSLAGTWAGGTSLNSAYTLFQNDHSISASNGNVNLLGTVIQSGNASGRTLSVTASGGNASLDSIALSRNNLSLDVSGDITATGAIEVGGFTLDRGHWRQVATLTELPTFSASDFRLAGGSFVRATGGDGSAATPYLLTDVYGLQGMGTLLSEHFALAGDVDASGTAKWNDLAGFSPIGRDDNTPFKGTFDGQGHVISGPTVNRPDQDFVGLFGVAQNATIRNVGLDNAKITGNSNVGGLVGYNYASNGGTASITNAYATGDVTGNDNVGGLVGHNYAADSSTASISNAYATGDVTGKVSVGGLVGYNVGADDGIITSTARIENAYATGDVTGNDKVGGLVGYNNSDSVFSRTARIINAYATGAVKGSDNVGGLVGENASLNTISNSYWDTATSGRIKGVGRGSSAGATGKTSAQLRDLRTYDRWDNIDSQGGTGRVWRIYDGDTMPLLRSFLKPVTVAASGMNGKIYDGTAASGTFTYTTSIADAVLDGAATYGTRSANAGSYAAGLGLNTGLYSGQSGYDIAYVGGTLTITPKPLTITARDKAKIYDGRHHAGGNGVTYDGFVDGETKDNLRGALTFGGDAQGARDAGSYTLTASGLNATNYDIAYVGGTLTITPKPLTITARDKAKIYDGQHHAGGNGVTYDGFVDGETKDNLRGALTFGGNAQGALDVGSYTLTASGYEATNYDIAYVHGTLTITPKPLTITARDKTKIYDGQHHAGGNGVTYDGFVDGETENKLRGTLTFGGDAQGARDAGSYTLTASGLNATNYDIAYVGGTLTITPKPLTITARDKAKIYDGQQYTGGNGVTYVGFVDGETKDNLRGALTFGGDAQGALDAGSYTLTASGYEATNYDIAYVDGTLTITPKPLTITARDKAKIYDGRHHAGGNGVTYDGFVDGETKDNLRGALTFGGNAQGALDAGSYTLTASGLNATNYDIAYVDGTLTIGKAPIIVTANGGRSTYGDNPSNPGLLAEGLVHGQDVSVLAGLTNSFGIDHDTDAGRHTLRVDGRLTNGNYIITERRDGTWTVDAKDITVTATGGRSTYGDTGQIDPGLTAEGLVNKQDVSVLAGLANSFGINRDTNAGSHTLRVDGRLTNGNYIVTERNDGTWIVDPKQIIVTANGGRSTYGDTNQINPGFTADGLVNGQDVSVLTGLTNSFGIDHDTNAGSHVLRVNDTLTNGNYTVTEARDGTWIVDPAHLLVTANNATRIANGIPYRGGNGVGYAGFVNGEDASVLEGTLTYGGSAQGATRPGIYGLTAEGLRSGNYRIDYRDGSLTIGAAQGLITAGQLENSAIDARYADRHDTPFGPRPSRLASRSQPDRGPSRLPLSFAENFIRVAP